MFCEKCGAELPENSSFCEKCGNKIGDAKSGTTKIQDDVVQYKVKPTYKFFYMMASPLITFLILFVIIVLPTMFFDMAVGGVLLLIMGIPFAIIVLIKTLINKKQYNCYEYCFYKTKVNYRDSFLNLSEKEVKYKYIREITMRQSFIQRMFNLGNVILFTNAETGFGNGIAIVNVENVKEVYEKIKALIDIE